MGPGLFSWMTSSTEKAEVSRCYHVRPPVSLNKVPLRFQCVIVPGMFCSLIDSIRFARCRGMGAGMAASRWDRICVNLLRHVHFAAGNLTRGTAMCFAITQDIVYAGEVGDESRSGLSGDAGCGAGRGTRRSDGGWYPDRRGNL